MRLTRTRRHPRDYSLPGAEAGARESAGTNVAVEPVNGDAPANGDVSSPPAARERIKDRVAPFADFEAALAEASDETAGAAEGDTLLPAESGWSLAQRAPVPLPEPPGAHPLAPAPPVTTPIAEPEPEAETDPEQIVREILERAVRDRASDVHIEPTADGIRVRVRTDGVLHRIRSLAGPVRGSLVSWIKLMSGMNVAEHERPQDRRIVVMIGGRDRDVRVSTAPTAFGEKCVMRILDKARAFIELPALGMAPETYDRYSDLIRSPHGMVICAGPGGSGTTTTLYASLGAIANDEINIVTIEDPIEYFVPTMNQIQVNEAAGLTFASGLRLVLGQDPDAILVGEIRDVETARLATQGALAGRFVVSSMHATDATSALRRLTDMGIESFLIASSLLGVVGQRLIRRVCELCAQPYTPTWVERSFFERAGGPPDKRDFVLGAGCEVCGNTGYSGCSGIYELLVVTEDMKDLIVSGAPRAQLRALAVEQRMTTLRDQAIRLVTGNATTITEALRTVYGL